MTELNFTNILTFAASGVAGVLVMVSLFRSRQSVAKWTFIAGMLLLGGESAFAALGLTTTDSDARQRWLMLSMVVGAMAPAVWLCFSLTYARGNYAEFLFRWRFVIGGTFALLGVGAVFAWLHPIRLVEEGDIAGEVYLLSPAMRFLSGAQLLVTLLILVNLEKTLRESMGTMRWRIKFLLLGLFVIFGARIYVRSQMLLFPALEVALASVLAGGLIVGGGLMVVTFERMGRDDVQIYPSRALLNGSISVLLVGTYLLVVGVLAQVVAQLGGTDQFGLQAFVVLLALAGLGVFLLSARSRQAVRVWVSRHLARPRHDFRRLWRLFTQRTSNARNERELAMEAVKLAGETLEALSATVWLAEGERGRVLCAATSSELQRALPDEELDGVGAAEIAAACAGGEPFNLEKAEGAWAEAIRRISVKQFNFCGDRMCVPLAVGEHALGVLVVGDRAGALPFNVEELDFLKCVADQTAVGILNFRLANELTAAKQMEAFQAMSTFFIHDLKNAAHGLNLTMTNLPDHFDDPEFRKDALRSISRISGRIGAIVERLNVLRSKLDLRLVEADLSKVVEAALADFPHESAITLERCLQAAPGVRVDPQQFQEVVTNLVANARDAMPGGGRIRVETALDGRNAVLVVEDNGCGMAPEFVENSLFRPFRTTKKTGMGIGLFHTKVLVEAHHGAIRVESEPGRGTAFRVSLPLAN